MFQKIISKINLGLCLTILELTQPSFGQNQTTPPPGPVPTDAPQPTVQKIPDLSFLKDPYYSCFNIRDSSVCEGYEFYIPNNGYYGTQFGTTSDDKCASDFDRFANEDINENSAFLLALCPEANIKHNTQYVAYRNSVYCGRIMYSQARWCRENDDNMRANPQLSLCKSTCIEYANSIVDYSQNICKNTNNDIAEKIKKNIIEQWCNIFSDEQGCIKGVKGEVKNCGFLSASISKEAQTFNPNNSCWKIEGKMEEIQNQALEESNKEIKMGAIRWKVIYPISAIIIVPIITAYFWMKQNKIYKIGYIEPPDDSANYKILPSHAMPSRDYVNESFIRSILESPQSTLKRNSSFSIRNQDNVRSSGNNNKKNVVFMIALYNYHPKMEDELELMAGDRIRVEHRYNDGWGAGINESTNKFGAFPLICCSENISTNDSAFPKRNTSTLRSRSVTVRNNSNYNNTVLSNNDRNNSVRSNAHSNNNDHNNSIRSNITNRSNSERNNSVRSNANHSNSNHSNSERNNYVRSNANHSNSNHSNSERNNSVRSNTNRSNSERNNSVRSNTNRSNSEHNNSVRSNTNRSNSERNNSVRSNTNRSNSERNNSVRSNTNRSNSERNNSVRSNTNRSNSNRSNNGRNNSNRSNSNRSNNIHSNNVRSNGSSAYKED